MIRAFGHRSITDVCRGFAQKNSGQKIREVLAGHDISDDLAHTADTFCRAPRKIEQRPSNGLPSHTEKVSPGEGCVWTSQLSQGGEMAIFRGALENDLSNVLI